MGQNKIRISMALLLASLILLMIYAADEMVESSPSLDERHDEKTESTETAERHEEPLGFLPFSEAIRGSVFAGGAIIISIIGFIIARREDSFALSVLLSINGLLIYAIMGIIILDISLASGLVERTNEPLVIGPVYTVGALMLIGLGIWKMFVGKLGHNNIK